MNLFELSLKINRFPIKKAKLTLQKIQRKDDTTFETYVLKKKKEIFNYHIKNNSFYKNIAKNADVNNWNSVPVMTKHDLQQPLKTRLSQGFTLKNVYVNKTSGSSGTPFVFAKDRFTHALTWAIILNRFGWFGLNFSTAKQARFYGIPLNKKGYYKERLKDFLSNRFRFSVFDLSDTALEKVLRKFKTTNFNYINGYTSAIVQFAKYLEKKNIVLQHVCPTLKACVVTSEMLFENDKKLLEKQFGIAVINEYGCAELGLIAFQNPDNIWQIINEDLFVEIVDSNNKILPFGETGRIVITSLYNKAHPLIRYDIGDIGAFNENSTIAKPILKKLIGRTSDIIILPSGKKVAGLAFYYITKSVIEDKNSIKEFIIEQLTIDTFKIIYISNFVISDEKKTIIKKETEAYLEPNLKVIFEKRSFLKRSKSGKLKQFISFVK